MTAQEHAARASGLLAAVEAKAKYPGGSSLPVWSRSDLDNLIALAQAHATAALALSATTSRLQLIPDEDVPS